VTRTIDIFCGAGGLSEGFREAGFDIRLGLDLAKHACATHEANFSEAATWCRDVRDVTGKALRDAVGCPVDVVIGGPNCQGGVALMVADQNIPLVHALTLNRRGLKADKDALLRLINGDTRQPASGVGSVAWRQANREGRCKREAQPAGRQPRQAKADTRDMGHGEVFIPRHLRGRGMRGPGHVFLRRQKSFEERPQAGAKHRLAAAAHRVFA
jgi:hypothetical protein